MISHIQKLREKLAAGQFCMGTAVTFTDPAVVEALCDSVDYLWIDLEHSPTSIETMMSHLIAARAGGAPALVRVPSSDIGWTKRVLDCGAEGIILPQAANAEEIRRFVSSCRYPNQGTRGFGPRRPTNYGRFTGREYLDHANENLFVVAQVETTTVVDEIDEIVAIDGLDSLVIGPYDLSGSMGKLGEIHDPEVLEAVEIVVKKASAAGITVGMGMAANRDHALKAAEMGINWVQCGNDYEFMIQACDRLYGDVRSEMS